MRATVSEGGGRVEGEGRGEGAGGIGVLLKFDETMTSPKLFKKDIM